MLPSCRCAWSNRQGASQTLIKNRPIAIKPKIFCLRRWTFNRTAPWAVKRAGIADDIGAGSSQPDSSGLWKEFEEKTAGLRGYLKESGGKP
jgi:hypothetical protein